jgi:hypothetical protein
LLEFRIVMETFERPLLSTRLEQRRLGDLFRLSSEPCNGLLEARASAWRIHRKRVAYFEPSRQLSELRREDEVIRYANLSGWEAR